MSREGKSGARVLRFKAAWSGLAQPPKVAPAFSLWLPDRGWRGYRMMKKSWEQAFEDRRSGITRAKYPSKDDPRSERPFYLPRFPLVEGDKVFTIGSCFARNIETSLKSRYILPALEFRAPYDEAPHSANTLLNEYNPGTMAQRIAFALSATDYPDSTIVPHKDGFLDLSLPGGFPVTFERARERRREISDIYAELSTSKMVIITLGLTEAWYDRKEGLYLNQMPPHPVMKASLGRYEFHRIEFEDASRMLERALGRLVDAGPTVLLTVSPVPLSSSFSGEDAVVANEYSKATLRLCAQRLHEKFEEVDYFPSFEMVRGLGRGAYLEDNVHVHPDVVDAVTNYMVERNAIAKALPALKPAARSPRPRMNPLLKRLSRLLGPRFS